MAQWQGTERQIQSGLIGIHINAKLKRSLKMLTLHISQKKLQRSLSNLLKTRYKNIVRKGVPAPRFFLRHPHFEPACPLPLTFLKSLFPLSSFLFHPLVRYFRQFPHPQATLSCPNLTHQPSLHITNEFKQISKE